MMPLIHNGVMNGMLAVSSSLAASIVAKVTITTALGLIGAWLARRSRAAVRHALLAAAFGVLLLLPAAAIVAPPLRVAVSAAAQERVTFAGVTEAIPPVVPEHASVGVTFVSRPWKLSTSALLLTGWIAGMALFLLPVVMGLRQVRSLRRSALPWRHGQLAIDRLALDAGIQRRVEVLLHEGLPGPMTCGVLHPAIVLPQDAQTWEGENLNRALVHELEHVRRGDWVSQCLARAVCAVYWFHPLVWIAWRKLALEAERSCDDAVLGRSEATAYADQLVALAKRLSLVAKNPAAKSLLLAMANRADLAARVGAVLDSRQRRGRAGTSSVALACAAAAVLVLTISPLTLVAAPQAAGTDVRVAPAPRFSSTTWLVTADVTVPDMTGKNIEGLRRNDFAITEDVKAQVIDLFEFVKPPAPRATPSSISSYYIVGYYTTNQNMDGKFREIKITRKDDTMARLNYRAGYYAESSNGAGSNGIGPSGVDDSSIPVAIYKPEPQYSEEARKAKWQGTATLSVDIDPSGAVTNIQVVRNLGLGLDQKAVEAVKQWKFRPGLKDGKPVTVQAQVEVNFRLL
jgi:TonB family protein